MCNLPVHMKKAWKGTFSIRRHCENNCVQQVKEQVNESKQEPMQPHQEREQTSEHHYQQENITAF